MLQKRKHSTLEIDETEVGTFRENDKTPTAMCVAKESEEQKEQGEGTLEYARIEAKAVTRAGAAERPGRADPVDALASGEDNMTLRYFPRMKDKQESSRLLLSVIHLLALASQSPSWKSFSLRSFSAIQRFISSTDTLPTTVVVRGTLAALPALLAHPWESIVCRSARLLGAMAINSYQFALQIVNDKIIVKALLNSLKTKNMKCLVASCQALSDIATSAQGRTALRDAGAVATIMHLLSATAGFTKSSWMSQKSQIVHQSQGEFSCQSGEMVLSAILQVLEVLIVDDSCQSLVTTPPDVVVHAFKSLQIIWKAVRDKRCRQLYCESVLPKLLVWLAMGQGAVSDEIYCDHNLCESLFGGQDTDFTQFWNKHWECAPVLIKEGAGGCETRANLFGKALHAGNGSFLLRGILNGALACPPFCADELEPSVIFEEIKGKLGQSLILGQDIRLLKSVHTDGCCSRQCMEENYYKITSGFCEMGDASTFVDVQTCLDAYELGYTVALRGMEFRCPQVAAITESLSMCFGQATVGSNMYVTPPNAQGLTLHYDDHCVLVWQLFGSKHWKVYGTQKQLPRLYSSIESIQINDISKEDSLNLCLMEGDVFYIPRGFPHEAHTNQVDYEHQRTLGSAFGLSEPRDTVQRNAISGKSVDESSVLQHSCIFDGKPKNVAVGENCLIYAEGKQHFESSSIPMNHECAGLNPSCSCMDQTKVYGGTCTNDATYSLHITFGVEVEPPFDWEGLVHMSLQCWAKQVSWEDILGSREYGADAVGELCTGLLHVAIRACGDRNIVFRKACLVGAKSFHPNPNNCTTLGEIIDFTLYFKNLMVIIASQLNFRLALDNVIRALDTPLESSLHWMCWLRHLSCKGDAALYPYSLSEPNCFFTDRLHKCFANRRLEELEDGFLKARDSFVSHINFEEACEAFHFLLQKYRGIRKRFINGMLALHD